MARALSLSMGALGASLSCLVWMWIPGLVSFPEALRSFPCSESAQHLITATVGTFALLSKIAFMGEDQPA